MISNATWVMVTWDPPPCGENDGQTRLKTLPSSNFVGGWQKVILKRQLCVFRNKTGMVSEMVMNCSPFLIWQNLKHVTSTCINHPIAFQIVFLLQLLGRNWNQKVS